MKLGQKKKLQKFLAILLVVACILPYAKADAATKTYSDIKGHKYETALKFAADNGLLTGKNKKISPDTYITRGDVLQAVNTLLGATETYDEMDSVTNMKQEDSYYSAVSIALNGGYIKRLEDNTVYLPTVKASRNYIASVLSKTLRLDKAGIIGKKDAKSKMTRGEFASLMMKYVPNIVNGSVTKLKSGNVVVNQPGVVLSNLTVRGNLIVGDGVGTGEIELDNVRITGKLIVRGGGENSVKIYGDSSISSIVVRQANSKVSIKVSGDAKVQFVYIDDGCNDVVIVGNVGTLEVAGDNLNVETKNGSIQNVVVNGSNANVSVDATSTIESIEVKETAAKASLNLAGTVKAVETSAANVSMTVQEGAVVESLVSNGNNAVISGNGTLNNAVINGNDSKINTPNTSVTIGENTTGSAAEDSTPSVNPGQGSGSAPEGSTPTVTPGAPEGSTPTVTPGAPEGSTPTVTPGAPEGPTVTPAPSEAYKRDERFEEGYPRIETAEGEYGRMYTKVVIKLKEGVAAENAPAYVYVAGTMYNTDHFNTSSDCVMHGHPGYNTNYSDGRQFHYVHSCSYCEAIEINDAGEYEVAFQAYNRNEGFTAFLVIETDEKISEVPTRIILASDTVSSFLDTAPPYVSNAYWSEPVSNDDKEEVKVRLYCSEMLSTENTAPVEAFSVTGSAMDAKVTSYSLHSSDTDSPYTNWIDLILEAEKGSNYDNMILLYTKPEEGGFTDVANTPNYLKSTAIYVTNADDLDWSYTSRVKFAKPDLYIENDVINVSEDGKNACVNIQGYSYYNNGKNDRRIEVYLNGELWKNPGTLAGTESYYFFLTNEAAQPVDVYEIEVKMYDRQTGAELSSYVNMLGEEVSSPIEFHSVGTVVDNRSFGNAVYTKSTKKLVFETNNNAYFSCGCMFVLNIDGEEYRLRGMIRTLYGNNRQIVFDEQCLFKLTDKLENASKVTIQYNPLTNYDSPYYNGGDSGKPLDRFVLDVTLTD